MSDNPFRDELAEALLADLTDRPQRCGHTSDPMCCPFENFPLLGAWFTQAAKPPAPLADDDPWATPQPAQVAGAEIEESL